MIKEANMKAAVAVKPNTPIEKVDNLIDDINMVLVMVSDNSFCPFIRFYNVKNQM